MSAAQAMSAAERKLRNARAVVVQAHPFFGALLLNQKVVERVNDPQVPTMATDGDNLYFNPEFVLRTPNDELHGVCAHEALHPGFCHHLRRGKRNPERWNEAADLVINPILLDAGFKLPEKALYREDCRGKNTEQVYAKLEAEQPPAQQPTPEQEAQAEEDAETAARGEQGTQEQQGADPSRSDAASDTEGDPEQQGQRGAGEASAGDATDSQGGSGDVGGCGWVRDAKEAQGNEDERQAAEGEWKQRMATAAMHAAGSMPGSLADAVRELLDPRADWRDLLRRYMTQLAATDYSWRSPNRRFVAQGTYLPALRDETIGRVAFVCDVSASMPAGAAQRALSEVATICTEIRPAGLDVVFFDTRVTMSAQYEVGDEPEVGVQIPGGGGTTFNTAYDWLAERGEEYSVVVFLTDLYPNDQWDTHRIPDAPVLWIDYADGSIVPPYGDEVVRMPREAFR